MSSRGEEKQRIKLWNTVRQLWESGLNKSQIAAHLSDWAGLRRALPADRSHSIGSVGTLRGDGATVFAVALAQEQAECRPNCSRDAPYDR